MCFVDGLLLCFAHLSLLILASCNGFSAYFLILAFTPKELLWPLIFL